MQLFAYRSIDRTRASRSHLEDKLAYHQRGLAPRRFSLPSSSVHSRSEVVESSLLHSSSFQEVQFQVVYLSCLRQSHTSKVRQQMLHQQPASLVCSNEFILIAVQVSLSQ